MLSAISGWGWLGVALGGALGSLTRVLVQACLAPWAVRFPWGTWTANVIGSLVIGLLAARWAHWPAHAGWRLFAMAGFLGGFTTFSSFSLENLLLIRQGRWGAAFAYTALTVLAGFSATALGFWWGRTSASP